MIEAWGRGFDKIKEACKKYDAPLPEYEINEDGIMVLCKACDKYMKLLKSDSKNTMIHLIQSDHDGDQDVIKTICEFCKIPHSAREIMDYIKINDRSFFRRHYLEPMLKSDQLKMTIPDKPKSGKQRYYTK